MSSFEVAMEVMEVMDMVGTGMSLKMGCEAAELATLFSLRVPMIICRISLLASPRTVSSAWMWSSLQQRGQKKKKSCLTCPTQLLQVAHTHRLHF